MTTKVNSRQVGYLPEGTGAVQRTAQEKLREAFATPEDFGGVGDGVTDDAAAAQRVLDAGKSLFFNHGKTYKIANRLLVTNPGTHILIGAKCTVKVSGWTYPGSQTPFGNQIHITANDCSVTGFGASSVIQLEGGSQANGIGVLHAERLHVANLVLDGGKAGVTSLIDDTFESGISIVASTGNGATIGQHLVENVIIRNWTQYGINVYGDRTDRTIIRNCIIHDNGKAAEHESVGAGIVLTRGIRMVTIEGCQIYGNKQNGIFHSSAGLDSYDLVFANNICTGNRTGIFSTEESPWGSVAGQGSKNITITGNVCRGNAKHGIQLGTYDNVGYLSNVTVTGNSCVDNTEFGILIQTNNHASDRTSRVSVTGNVLNGNAQHGIALGLYLDSSVSVKDNVVIGNTAGQISNSGSATVFSNETSTSIPFYAAGSFTPVIVGATTAGAATYSAQSGRYTKVGNRVMIDILLDWSAHTGTGDLKITGLPFASDGDEPQGVSWMTAHNLTLTGQGYAFIPSSGTAALLYQADNGVGSPIPMDTAGQLRLSGSYRTAA